MKKLFLLLAVSIPAFAIAEDIKTTKGVEYKGAAIMRAEPDGLMVMYSAGIVKIPFEELSKELQEKYQYDPVEGAAYSARLAQQQAALLEQAGVAKQKNAAVQNARFQQDLEAIGKKRERQRISGFGLDAHETATGVEVGHKWETNWGSYDRDYKRSKRILISVHDLSRSSADCRAEVYFIARTLSDNTLYIYDHKTVSIRMTNGLEAKTEIDATPLSANIQNYAALNERYVAGAEICGWIVLGMVGDQTFGSHASTQALATVLSGSGWKALLDDYERATKSDR